MRDAVGSPDGWRAACSASPSTSGTLRDEPGRRLRRGRGKEPHVEEHGEDVGSLPVLDDAAVAESHVVDAADANPLARRLDTEERPEVSPEPSSRNETMSPSSMIVTSSTCASGNP